MRSTIATIGAGIALAALVATGAAAGFKKYGEAAGWEVAINDNMGLGSLITKSADDVQVQLGINALSAEKTGYMTARF